MKLKVKIHDSLITAAAVIFIFTMFKYISELAGFVTLSFILFAAGFTIAWCKR